MDDENLEVVLPATMITIRIWIWPNLWRNYPTSIGSSLYSGFEDMKIDEIAEVLHENVSTVKTRLYQGLQRLRVNLSEEDQEEAQR